MILDTLENFGKYIALNPLFPKVAEYLQTQNLSAHEPGKEMIDGNDLFVNYSITKGKTKDAARIETHNEMIDILKGMVFGSFDRTTAKEREALNIAIEALEQEPIDKSAMMYEIYMEGVNMTGEYQGCWVRFKDIKKIVDKYMGDKE